MTHETDKILHSFADFISAMHDCSTRLIDGCETVTTYEYYKGKSDAFEICLSWVESAHDMLKGIESNDRP